jgi:hypothetical protein
LVAFINFHGFTLVTGEFLHDLTGFIRKYYPSIVFDLCDAFKPLVLPINPYRFFIKDISFGKASSTPF